MTNAAQKVWKAFKAELTQPATDDIKEALATSIREIANQCAYTHLHIDGDHGIDVVNVKDIMSIIDELEKLNTLEIN